MKDFLHAIIGLCRALAVRHRTCWCAHMCVYNFVLPRPQVGGNPSPVNTQILLARTKNHDQIAMHRQNGKTNQFLPMVWAIAKASSCVMHTMLCFFIILASLELKSGCCIFDGDSFKAYDSQQHDRTLPASFFYNIGAIQGTTLARQIVSMAIRCSCCLCVLVRACV